ncbi:MAG: hypothetical protein H7122_06350 [Chitinophagaceae bacterium]|nr:hypothetical protein [Chitinophagaceae bacterium]
MKFKFTPKNEITIWYRLKRYPQAAIMSLFLVIAFTYLVCYGLNKIYPDLNLLDKVFPGKSVRYHFYSGFQGGTYYTIGDAIKGPFANEGDSLVNCSTKGGYENAMKVIIQKNSFGLIQEEIIHADDPLRKNVRFITPLFLERMHIFYRKSLFKNCNQPIQLSATTDPGILRCLSDSVKGMILGPVGSGTRILASYILTLMGQQINTSLKTFPKYKQVDMKFREAFGRMLSGQDSLIDILFYVAADPIEPIKSILDSTDYGLMSIDPSMVVRLNKDFNLSLRIADFKDKYEQTDDVSTIGTLAYLIGSKTIRDNVVLSLLNKINASKDTIHSKLIGHNSEYKLPLNEFGFFNSFSDDYMSLKKFQWRELAAFIFSVITLFFPVFRSVNRINSILKSWSLNKQIDDALAMFKKSTSENIGLARYQVHEILSGLREELIDLYGDGILPESNFTPLMQRITLHLEKLPGDGKVKHTQEVKKEEINNLLTA